MSKSQGNFWNLQGYNEKKWFGTVSIGLIILIAIYIVSHFFNNSFGYEYAKLDEKQIQQINKIYFTDPMDTNRVKNGRDTTALKNHSQPIKDKKIINSNDSINKDSTKQNNLSINVANANLSNHSKDSCNCDSANKCDRVLEYLTSEYSIDSQQIASFKRYLYCAKPLEATSFLANLKLRVESYFWLKGPSSYFEIVFWTLFGVLCNILFGLGIISKNSTNNPNDPTTYFDSSEIPSQVAKLFYAPLCTLTIVFGYNYFSGQSLADISSSKGVIVFGFIGGFFSERLIAFLDRLKDVLLPNSGKADIPQTKQASLRNIVLQLIKPPSEEDIDLSSAIVTLIYTLTGEIINAKNINKGQQTLFIADFVKPGVYKIEAKLDTKDMNGNTMLWKGSENLEMKSSDLFIPVKLNRES